MKLLNLSEDRAWPTATAALAQIQQGQLLPSQLLESTLARLEQREPAVKAWTHLAITAARQQAAKQDQQLRDRSIGIWLKEQPLYGIPIAIKDIFATVDMPTAWGFPPYAGCFLNEEAAVITRLRRAGAIILGKTVTTELATATAGPTRNPHNLNHTPGGSSSGSAAAVADGMVPISIGSQTMGSSYWKATHSTANMNCPLLQRNCRMYSATFAAKLRRKRRSPRLWKRLIALIRRRVFPLSRAKFPVSRI